MSESWFKRIKQSLAARKAYRRAVDAFEQIEFEQAAEHIRQHAPVLEKDSMACQILGRALYETDHLGEAAGWLEKASELSPHNPANHLYLAYIRYAMEDLDKTEAALKQAANADPENPLGFYLKGLCKLRRGSIAEAEVLFEKFAGFEKGTVFTRLLAMAELYMQREAESVAEVDRIVEKVEQDLDAPENRPGLPVRLMESLLGVRMGYPDRTLAKLLTMAELYFKEVESGKQ